MLRMLLHTGYSLPSRLRRWWFVERTRLMARLLGVDVTIEVHPSVRVGHDCKIEVAHSGVKPWKRKTTIRIGEGTVIQDRFRLFIDPNLGQEPQFLIGPHCHFADDVAIYLSGKIFFEGGIRLNKGVVLRIQQGLHWGAVGGCGEYVSMFDSHHAFDEKGEVDVERIAISDPIKFGRIVGIGAKSSVNPGTVLSDVTAVLPHSVVSGHWLTPAILLGGTPAKPKGGNLPTLSNPMVQAVVCWAGGEPGPMYRTSDEALAQLPDPVTFDPARHGYAARRLEDGTMAAVPDTASAPEDNGKA